MLKAVTVPDKKLVKYKCLILHQLMYGLSWKVNPDRSRCSLRSRLRNPGHPDRTPAFRRSWGSRSPLRTACFHPRRWYRRRWGTLLHTGARPHHRTHHSHPDHNHRPHQSRSPHPHPHRLTHTGRLPHPADHHRWHRRLRPAPLPHPPDR